MMSFKDFLKEIDEQETEMKLNEINMDKVELMKKVKTRSETAEAREARREHAKKAIASNFKKGFISKEVHDRQMKEQGE
ncbi:hypothetical protein E4H12_06360 [Candidatus Thorarchaeota archaeon]|nr:MAG: hypothetical protein E4H12_06360 [Candidatus Thorarchaeota archaeon]